MVKTPVKTPARSLGEYLNLNYPMTLHADSDGGYVAEVRDLPGCVTQGETLEEAIANVNEARQLWIETVYKSGKRNIPLPSTEHEYSGKFVLRTPKTLHRRLAKRAEAEGVSLNQYIISVLSEFLGRS